MVQDKQPRDSHAAQGERSDSGEHDQGIRDVKGAPDHGGGTRGVPGSHRRAESEVRSRASCRPTWPEAFSSFSTSAGVRYSRELRAAYDYLRGRVMAEAGPLEISGLRA